MATNFTHVLLACMVWASQCICETELERLNDVEAEETLFHPAVRLILIACSTCLNGKIIIMNL